MKIISAVVAFCFFSTITALAQNREYIPGMYVTISNDTIHGIIQLSHSTGFSFKQLTDTTRHLVPYSQVKYFQAGESKYYIWNGKRNMAYLDNDYQLKNIDSMATGIIPIKYIAGGSKISLYYFKDITDHYFAEVNGTLTELYQLYRFATFAEKQKVLYNPPTFIITPHYRNVLLSLLDGNITDRQRLAIANVNYDKQSLILLMRMLNKSKKNN